MVNKITSFQAYIGILFAISRLSIAQVYHSSTCKASIGHLGICLLVHSALTSDFVYVVISPHLLRTAAAVYMYSAYSSIDKG